MKVLLHFSLSVFPFFDLLAKRGFETVLEWEEEKSLPDDASNWSRKFLSLQRPSTGLGYIYPIDRTQADCCSMYHLYEPGYHAPTHSPIMNQANLQLQIGNTREANIYPLVKFVCLPSSENTRHFKFDPREKSCLSDAGMEQHEGPWVENLPAHISLTTTHDQCI